MMIAATIAAIRLLGISAMTSSSTSLSQTSIYSSHVPIARPPLIGATLQPIVVMPGWYAATAAEVALLPRSRAAADQLSDRRYS